MLYNFIVEILTYCFTIQVTVKEQQEWKIPPCISNWKNVKGYTIPLDKRLAADGRGLQGVHINENFAKFAEALYIADRKVSLAVHDLNMYFYHMMSLLFSG